MPTWSTGHPQSNHPALPCFSMSFPCPTCPSQIQCDLSCDKICHFRINYISRCKSMQMETNRTGHSSWVSAWSRQQSRGQGEDWQHAFGRPKNQQTFFRSPGPTAVAFEIRRSALDTFGWVHWQRYFSSLVDLPGLFHGLEKRGLGPSAIRFHQLHQL